MLRISNLEEYEALKNNNRRLVIFYSSNQCEACVDTIPLYERIAKRYHKRVTLAYCDIDECRLNFEVVPVFVSFYKGHFVNRMEGVNSINLKLFIKEVIETKNII